MNEYAKIGTSAPGKKQDVVCDANGIGANYALAQLRVSGATNANQRLVLGYDTTGSYGMVGSYTFGGKANPLALNPAGGNVGIGSTTPNNTPDVTGEISASSGVIKLIYSTQPGGRFSGIAVGGASYLTGASLTISVPAGAARRYRIVMRQMLHNGNAGQAVLFLNTSNSSTNIAALVIPHVALNANLWSTVNTESYVTLTGGTTVTYYAWVAYYMTPSAPAIANESSSNRVYCDLFAVLM